MNKEEILAKSREENKDVDLVEIEVNKKSEGFASLVSAIVCFALYAAELIICGEKNYSLWSILTAAFAANYLYKGIKLKDKSKLIFGVLWTITSVLTIVTAVIVLLKRSNII